MESRTDSGQQDGRVPLPRLAEQITHCKKMRLSQKLSGGPERPLKWQFDQRTLTCKTPKFGRRDQGLQLRSPEEHARRRARSRLRARHAASEDFTRSARRAGDDADKDANQNRSL